MRKKGDVETGRRRREDCDPGGDQVSTVGTHRLAQGLFFAFNL